MVTSVGTGGLAYAFDTRSRRPERPAIVFFRLTSRFQHAIIIVIVVI